MRNAETSLLAASVTFLLLTSSVFAQEVSAGITPDSWLYGLDVAIDQITLLLNFDNGDKARKGLEIARERLLEVKGR